MSDPTDTSTKAQADHSDEIQALMAQIERLKSLQSGIEDGMPHDPKPVAKVYGPNESPLTDDSPEGLALLKQCFKSANQAAQDAHAEKERKAKIEAPMKGMVDAVMGSVMDAHAGDFISRGHDAPAPIECSSCGVAVVPLKMGAGKWFRATVCGEPWNHDPRPGAAEPRGCLGKQDHQAWLEQRKRDRQTRVRMALAAAGVAGFQMRKKLKFSLLDRLAHFEKPDDRDDDCEAPYVAYLFGGKRTGKTTQLAVACKTYIEQGWSCRYTTTTTLFASLKGEGDTPAKMKVRDWLAFDLVAIDDIGEAMTTPWRGRVFKDILQARHLAGKVTLLASRYSPRGLDRSGHLGGSFSDEIFEMVGSVGQGGPALLMGFGIDLLTGAVVPLPGDVAPSGKR